MARNSKNAGAYAWADLGVKPTSFSGTTEVLSSAIDRMTADEQGFLSAKLILNTGVTSGSPSSFTVIGKITHCATSGGSYTDYTDPSTGSAASVTASAASTGYQLNVDLSNANRYIKVSLTPAFVSGTSPTVLAAGALVLMGAHKAPPASTTT